MLKMQNDGPYIIRNPLSRMKNEIIDITGGMYDELFGSKWKYEMRVDCPEVGRIYGVHKIHKPGNKKRPIVGNASSSNSK